FAATVFVPGEQHVGVHRITRARAPQRKRGVFAVAIHEHTVATVEHAFRHRVEQAERRHHGSRREHLDFEIATGHVGDALAEVLRVFVEDILRRPGALEPHIDRSLRLDDGRCGYRSNARDGGATQELTAARSRITPLMIVHFIALPVISFVADYSAFGSTNTSPLAFSL